MPLFPCRLSQSIYLGNNFIITPVAIGKQYVELEITAYRGDRLLRAERLLQLLDEIWTQDEGEAGPLPGEKGGGPDWEPLN